MREVCKELWCKYRRVAYPTDLIKDTAALTSKSIAHCLAALVSVCSHPIAISGKKFCMKM